MYNYFLTYFWLHTYWYNIFQATAAVRQGNDIVQIEMKLADFKGKYLVLFFYPQDFTFVCPTEIIAFSNRVEEFKKIGCEVIGCSTDSANCHRAWMKTPRTDGGLGDIDLPLLADPTHVISKVILICKRFKRFWAQARGQNWPHSSNIVTSRGKSLLEFWGTTFLPNWQPTLIFVWFTSKSHAHYPHFFWAHAQAVRDKLDKD